MALNLAWKSTQSRGHNSILSLLNLPTEVVPSPADTCWPGAGPEPRARSRRPEGKQVDGRGSGWRDEPTTVSYVQPRSQKDEYAFPIIQPFTKTTLMIYHRRPSHDRLLSRNTLPTAKLLRSSTRMWRAILNEFLSRLQVCLTGQIYPYNYIRANHANRFPWRRQALKKQRKGKGKGEVVLSSLPSLARQRRFPRWPYRRSPHTVQISPGVPSSHVPGTTHQKFYY